MMKNNLENSEILSPEILVVIDLIIKTCPNVVFGGSIALNAVGVINRKINDIDIFFSKMTSLSKNNFLDLENAEDSEFMSDTVTDMNGKPIQRTGIKIRNVKCCVFKIDDEELQHSKFNFLGRIINIQNINYAIQAKRSYASNHEGKHETDMKWIDDFLNSLI